MKRSNKLLAIANPYFLDKPGDPDRGWSDYPPDLLTISPALAKGWALQAPSRPPY